MRLKSIWYHQLKALLPTLFTAYIPILLLLCILAIVILKTKIPILDLTRDPARTLRAPFYIGLLSHIGVLLWCSSAAICLFSFALLRKDINDRELQSFFLFAGLITSVLLLDDLFQFHEHVFPIYLHIPEKVIYIGYGTMTLLYIIRFKQMILKTEPLLLLFAFGFFGLSIVIDAIIILPLHDLFEDGFKLLGIVSWLTYFTRVFTKQIKCTVG